ncbi:hypothetical protein ABE10_12680 [Bacillus toyonensis]|nr:hypothetical protein [Bacillus toyonensis]
MFATLRTVAWPCSVRSSRSTRAEDLSSQLRVHALEPGRDDAGALALFDEAHHPVRQAERPHRVRGGLARPLGPFTDGARLVHASDERDELGAQRRAQLIDQLGAS